MKFLYALLIFSALSSWSWATEEKSCSKVDLSSQLGPVREQTGGSCYAYAAAELLSFENGIQYSALALAILSAETTKKTEEVIAGLQGGKMYRALEWAMANRLCLERDLPSTKFLEDDYANVADYYSALEESRIKNSAACTIEQLNVPSEDLLAMEQIKFKYYQLNRRSFDSSVISGTIKYLFPRVDKKLLADIYASSANMADFFKSLVLSSCADNFSSPRRQKINNEWKKSQFLSSLNAALDSKKPAGISYQTSGLIKPSGEGAHASHASVLAGRLWAEGKCHYLVKNSWGKDWKVPANLKAKNSADYPGYFVVAEDDLIGHLTGVTTLE